MSRFTKWMLIWGAAVLTVVVVEGLAVQAYFIYQSEHNSPPAVFPPGSEISYCVVPPTKKPQ